MKKYIKPLSIGLQVQTTPLCTSGDPKDTISVSTSDQTGTSWSRRRVWDSSNWTGFDEEEE